MLTVHRPMGALLAGVAMLVTGCATQSARLHEVAARAMVEAGQLERTRQDIVVQPRATTEESYSSPHHRWSIVYPADWKLNDDGRFLRLSRGQAVLGIHSVPEVNGKSLDGLADSAVQAWERRMQSVNSVRRVSRQRLSLPGGVTAIAVVHHIGAGQIGKSLKVIVLVRDRGFVIDAETHLVSWPDYERDFNRIIDSFRVLQ